MIITIAAIFAILAAATALAAGGTALLLEIRGEKRTRNFARRLAKVEKIADTQQRQLADILYSGACPFEPEEYGEEGRQTDAREDYMRGLENLLSYSGSPSKREDR